MTKLFIHKVNVSKKGNISLILTNMQVKKTSINGIEFYSQAQGKTTYGLVNPLDTERKPVTADSEQGQAFLALEPGHPTAYRLSDQQVVIASTGEAVPDLYWAILPE